MNAYCTIDKILRFYSVQCANEVMSANSEGLVVFVLPSLHFNAIFSLARGWGSLIFWWQRMTFFVAINEACKFNGKS